MSDDELRRRRGRPRIEPAEETIPVHVKLSASQYRDVEADARAQRITVPEAIRRQLQRRRADP